MNPPRCTDLDYINFLIAAQKVFTCTEAARCQPETPTTPAHDAFTRLLRRQPQDTEALWRDAQTIVDKEKGILVLDDTTLDKPYAKNMDLVTYHWSGKHHRVVKGINLLTLLWSDGEAHIPCDFRVYDKPTGGSTKNESFREMLVEAMERGFKPDWVLFDSWYSSLGNLKLLRSLGWRWLTRLKANRLVDPDGNGNVQGGILGSRLRVWWFILRDTGWSRCSASSPRTGRRSTGLPVTWKWMLRRELRWVCVVGL